MLNGNIQYVLSILFLGLWHMQLSGQGDETENGFVQFFYPNDQVSSEGMMRDGKPRAGIAKILWDDANATDAAYLIRLTTELGTKTVRLVRIN